MSKHNKTDLLQMQSLPLAVKIIMSQRRIRDWYDYWNGQVYVSFSGGKDSTVLKHLVETTIGEMYNSNTDLSELVPSVFVNTGLEYPEIQRFAMSQPNVTTVRPEKRFDEVVKEYGYPVVSKELSNNIRGARNSLIKGVDSFRLKKMRGELLDKDGKPSAYNAAKKHRYLLDAPFKISDQCCDVMKKKPTKTYEKETGRKPFIGTMAEESRLRQSKWFEHGCNAFNKGRPTSQPLSFWTEQDILEYIVTYNLPYASIYGEILQDEDGKYYTTGAKRTGCMFCMFGMSQDGCPNRFQRMKETHPNQYKYCMKPVEEGGLGLAKVLDFMGEKY